MSKYLTALKHGAKRLWPLGVTASGAVLASDSFRHYVQHHPSVAAAVPAVMWLLHALEKPKP